MESVEQKNGEGPEWSRQGQGSAQQADVVGFRDQPKLKLARARKIVRASTFQCRMDGCRSGRPFPPSRYANGALSLCRNPGQAGRHASPGRLRAGLPLAGLDDGAFALTRSEWNGILGEMEQVDCSRSRMASGGGFGGGERGPRGK